MKYRKWIFYICTSNVPTKMRLLYFEIVMLLNVMYSLVLFLCELVEWKLFINFEIDFLFICLSIDRMVILCDIFILNNWFSFTIVIQTFTYHKRCKSCITLDCLLQHNFSFDFKGTTLSSQFFYFVYRFYNFTINSIISWNITSWKWERDRERYHVKKKKKLSTTDWMWREWS